MGSFWGVPTHEPKDKDVARHLGVIREQCAKFDDVRALGLATTMMRAAVAFISMRFGARETMAVLDRLKADVQGGEL